MRQTRSHVCKDFLMRQTRSHVCKDFLMRQTRSHVCKDFLTLRTASNKLRWCSLANQTWLIMVDLSSFTVVLNCLVLRCCPIVWPLTDTDNDRTMSGLKLLVTRDRHKTAALDNATIVTVSRENRPDLHGHRLWYPVHGPLKHKTDLSR